MKDDRLSEILANWREYQRRPDTRIGYPRRSAGFQAAGGSWDGYGWDEDRADMPQSEAYAVVDEAEAEIVQTVIDDLPGAEKDAVYNVVMGTRRPLGEPLQDVYLRARGSLKIALYKRSVY